MAYVVLTNKSVREATNEETIVINEQQLALIKLFNIDINEKVKVQYANGNQHIGILKDFIQNLPINSNYDLVKFANGHYGFVSDDEMHLFEIVRFMDEKHFDNERIKDYEPIVNRAIDIVNATFCDKCHINYQNLPQDIQDNIDKAKASLMQALNESMKYEFING